MSEKLTALELFAGVGGFRLGLQAAGVEVIWSNQWEPGKKRQIASEIYVQQFGGEGHTNEDIKVILDFFESNRVSIPDADLLVAGFPCQDYSVAKVLPDSKGILGKKGVLWWEIHRLLNLKRPKYVLLENVDRLLSSPSNQRGRDFAVMISSMRVLGYEIEWRIVNSADYSSHQRRKRVFIFGSLESSMSNAEDFEQGESVLSRTFLNQKRGPVRSLEISDDPKEASELFNFGNWPKPFENSGVSSKNGTFTVHCQAITEFPRTLGQVLVESDEVPEEFWIDGSSLEKWQFAKGAKEIFRRSKESSFEYAYKEGPMSFPDSLDKPSRTIVTGEGGSSVSRFKHVVVQDGRLRRLVPIELERLNGFPDNWTLLKDNHLQVTPVQRAFLMGNALVVPMVMRIAQEITRRHAAQLKERQL